MGLITNNGVEMTYYWVCNRQQPFVDSVSLFLIWKSRNPNRFQQKNAVYLPNCQNQTMILSKLLRVQLTFSVKKKGQAKEKRSICHKRISRSNSKTFNW